MRASATHGGCDCKLLTARRVKPRIRPPPRFGRAAARFRRSGLHFSVTTRLRLQPALPRRRYRRLEAEYSRLITAQSLSSLKKAQNPDPAPSAPRLRPRAPRQVRAHGQGRAEEGTPQIRRASQGRRHRRHGRLCGRGHVVGRLQGRAPRSTGSGGSIRRSSRRRRRREPRSTTSTSAGGICATDGCAGTDTASPLRTSRRPQGSSSHAGASRRDCTGATTTPHGSAPSSPDCAP